MYTTVFVTDRTFLPGTPWHARTSPPMRTTGKDSECRSRISTGWIALVLFKFNQQCQKTAKYQKIIIIVTKSTYKSNLPSAMHHSYINDKQHGKHHSTVPLNSSNTKLVGLLVKTDSPQGKYTHLK